MGTTWNASHSTKPTLRSVIGLIGLIAGLAAGLSLAVPASAAAQHSGQAGSRQGASGLAGTPVTTGALWAVSCKGPTFCLTTGSDQDSHGSKHAFAETWNGATWRLVAKPPGRTPHSLSCSGPSFCMAQGGPTGTETWNGRTWRELPSPKGGIAGVSCGSRKLCMVISDGLVRSWNGSTWHLWRQQTNACGGPPGFPCGMASVSCGSATNCVTVGTQTISQEPIQVAVGAYWNGKEWNGTAPPADGDPAGMNVVSCAPDFCMAAGGDYSEVDNGSVAAAGAWDATTHTWQDVAPNLGDVCTGFGLCYWTADMSCASSTNCLAFRAGGGMAWNGATWTQTQTVSAGPGTSLGSASCGGTTCLAVGHWTKNGHPAPAAELWNGSAWSILPAPKLP